MKMSTVSIADAVSYKTAFVSSLHLSEDMRSALLHLADEQECYYCLRTSNRADTAIILRFDHLLGDYTDLIELTRDNDTHGDLITLITALDDNGYGAIHFDNECDLLRDLPWFTASGSRVAPLGYDIDIVGYYDMPTETQKLVLSHLDENEEDAAQNSYFICDGHCFSIADFMRLDGNSEMKDYGYSAEYGESNTSAILISLSDDSETVDVVRVA